MFVCACIAKSVTSFPHLTPFFSSFVEIMASSLPHYHSTAICDTFKQKNVTSINKKIYIKYPLNQSSEVPQMKQKKSIFF